jgi:hypothetical protein
VVLSWGSVENCTLIIAQTLKKLIKAQYSQTCVQRPPLGPEKSVRLTEVSDKTEI